MLAYRARGRFGFIDADERESAAGWAVARAVQRYRPDKGAKLSTWVLFAAPPIVRRQLGRLAGKPWPVCETDLAAGRAVDDGDGHRDGVLATIATVDPPDDDAGDLATLLAAAKLTDRERDVLRMLYLDGLTHGEAAG